MLPWSWKCPSSFRKDHFPSHLTGIKTRCFPNHAIGFNFLLAAWTSFLRWSPLTLSFYLNLFFIIIFIIIIFYCSGFCHTLKWHSHGFTCVPHPDPPSHLPLHPIPLGLPSVPDWMHEPYLLSRVVLMHHSIPNLPGPPAFLSESGILIKWKTRLSM